MRVNKMPGECGELRDMVSTGLRVTDTGKLYNTQ